MRKTNKARKNPGANWIRNLRIPHLLYGVGATILLGSWIAQNYFREAWRAEVQYLENTQHLVEIKQIDASLWMRELNSERKRSPVDQSLLASAAYNFVAAAATVFAWCDARVAEEGMGQAFPILVKNAVVNKARTHFESVQASLGESVSHVDSLLALAEIVTKANSEFMKTLDARFADKMNEARGRSSRWNALFLAGYLIGTCVLGIRWLIVVRSEMSLQSGPADEKSPPIKGS